MPESQFKVYYSDHTIYEGDPFNTPIFKVLVIVERHKNHGRILISGGDYYGWDGKHWLAFDYPGLLQYLMEPGPRRVLIGIKVEEDEWNAVMRKAYYDPDFPPKTSKASYERTVT